MFSYYLEKRIGHVTFQPCVYVLTHGFMLHRIYIIIHRCQGIFHVFICVGSDVDLCVCSSPSCAHLLSYLLRLLED